MGLVMKKLLLLFVSLIWMVSCASVPNVQEQVPTEIKRSTVIFDSVNSKIFGEVWKPEESMTGFNLIKYKEILTSQQSSRAKELREILESYESQVLRGFENTYVFCVFSSKLGFAMCDDARCSGVEKSGFFTSSEIIETWWKELPLTNCSQH